VSQQRGPPLQLPPESAQPSEPLWASPHQPWWEQSRPSCQSRASARTRVRKFRADKRKRCEQKKTRFTENSFYLEIALGAAVLERVRHQIAAAFSCASDLTRSPVRTRTGREERMVILTHFVHGGRVEKLFASPHILSIKRGRWKLDRRLQRGDDLINLLQSATCTTCLGEKPRQCAHDPPYVPNRGLIVTW
jgi:hypothetical protein